MIASVKRRESERSICQAPASMAGGSISSALSTASTAAATCSQSSRGLTAARSRIQRSRSSVR
jgi:hypothetical protein